MAKVFRKTSIKLIFLENFIFVNGQLCCLFFLRLRFNDGVILYFENGFCFSFFVVLKSCLRQLFGFQLVYMFIHLLGFV